MSKKVKIFVIVIGVIALLILIFSYVGNSAPAATGTLSSTSGTTLPGGGGSVAPAQNASTFSSLLSSISSISLDTTIFSNPAYIALRDNPVVLGTAVIGRQNPFAPLLTLEDVLTLKLNADWVVLSACNTASADGKAEEALSGLARGFFYAGSRSLLVTHWAVESESAKALTTGTFAHYTANPQAPKAESLRQAMLQVMAMPRFSHPAYWAPYALVGDGGR